MTDQTLSVDVTSARSLLRYREPRYELKVELNPDTLALAHCANTSSKAFAKALRDFIGICNVPRHIDPPTSQWKRPLLLYFFATLRTCVAVSLGLDAQDEE